MRDEIDVGLAEQVVRAHQREERLAAQVAEIDEAEATEAQVDAGRPRILLRLARLGRRRRTVRIRLTATVDRLRDGVHVAADDAHVEALERQPIAGLRHDMPPARAHRLVGLEDRCGAVVARHDGVVIDEGANRQELGQLGHTAGVIAVEVREQQIVDLRDAGRLGRRGDAPRIAAAVAGVTGVDQQRLPRRRDDQRRLTAFDVDEVDVQGRRGACHQRATNDRHRTRHTASLQSSHPAILILKSSI